MRKKLPVARVGEIAPGKTKVFRFGVQNGIAYNDNGVIRAYVNACTHMGGPTELCESGTLRCRWHEAEFDPKTGIRVCGQAPEGTTLQPIALETDNDQIVAIFEWNDPFSN